MARDQRWPFIPFVIVRSVQGLFALINLAITAYIVSYAPAWYIGMGLATSLFTLIYVVINFVLYFMGLLLPLAIVIVDAFLLLFYLISMAGTGTIVGSDCYVVVYGWYTYDSGTYTPCLVAKGAFAMELLSMFLFIASLVYASIILHRNRKDLRGEKYNAGMPPISSADQEGAVAPDMSVQQPQMTYQQPDQGIAPPMQPQPVYDQQVPMQPMAPMHVPSQYEPNTFGPPPAAGSPPPPASPPPPMMQPQSTGTYSTLSGSTAAGAGYPPQVQTPPPQQQYNHGEYGVSEMPAYGGAPAGRGNELP